VHSFRGTPLTHRRSKDGGAFASFRYTLAEGESESDVLGAIERRLKRQIKSVYAPGMLLVASWGRRPSVHVVRGTPWREDLARFPARQVRIAFEGGDGKAPDEQTLWEILRPYGRVSSKSLGLAWRGALLEMRQWEEHEQRVGAVLRRACVGRGMRGEGGRSAALAQSPTVLMRLLAPQILSLAIDKKENTAVVGFARMRGATSARNCAHGVTLPGGAKLIINYLRACPRSAVCLHALTFAQRRCGATRSGTGSRATRASCCRSWPLRE
jgi:hypothetical protein